MLCIDDAAQVMPHVAHDKLVSMLPFLNAAMVEGQIIAADDKCVIPPVRAAAFLAQLAHESGEFRYMEELADGKAYEGRKDLGNILPGDGPRFKGRGPIQITGRANYTAAGKVLGLDLAAHPETARTPEVGFRLAAWFWNSRGLNAHADSICDSADPKMRAYRFDQITRRINGGFNGKAQRDAYFAKACAVLKVKFA